MFRFKGWANRLNRMTAAELIDEQRRLRRARSFIFEKEEKLHAIADMLRPKPSREELLSLRPGGIMRVNGEWA